MNGNGLGLVHIYTGDGKGKTTASVGLAVRAAGCGIPVLFVQFLKNLPSGELESFQRIGGITVLRGKAGKGFSADAHPHPKILSIHLYNEYFAYLRYKLNYDYM